MDKPHRVQREVSKPLAAAQLEKERQLAGKRPDINHGFDQRLDRGSERGATEPSLQAVEKVDMVELDRGVDVDHRIVRAQTHSQPEGDSRCDGYG